MTTPPRRAGASLALVAAVSAVLVASLATPAAAHAQLIRSSPSPSERLQAPPDHVELEFDSDLLDLGVAILVVDADGTDWADAEAKVDGTIASVPIRDDLPGDTGYQVRWRVVAGDGHPISGIVPFAVGNADPLMSTATGGAGAATADPGVSGSAPPGSDPSGNNTSVLRTVLIGAGGAAAAVGLFALVTLLARRTRRPGGPGGASE